MSIDFPSQLRRFRENKRLSQKKLADLLECGRVIVRSWEGGDNVPPREIIIEIGRVLELGPDDVDILLSLAGYELLSGEDLVSQISNNLVSLGMFPGNIKQIQLKEEFSNIFNTTEKYMGGDDRFIGRQSSCNREHAWGN